MTICSSWALFFLGLRNSIMPQSLQRWWLCFLPWCTLCTLYGSIQGWCQGHAILTTKGSYYSDHGNQNKKVQFAVILAWENSWHFAMPLPISHEMTYEERQKKLNTVDPDLGNAFDWKKQNNVQPIGSTTLIWEVKCHLIGVSVAILDCQNVLYFVFLVNK